MKSFIDKITHEPLRHWQRFIKGFTIFMLGVALWYADLGLLYLGVTDATAASYSDPSKIIGLVFIGCGTIIAAIGYAQILICRLLPSRVQLNKNS